MLRSERGVERTARRGIERKRDGVSRGFSGSAGLAGVNMGLGMPAPLPPPGAGSTTIMTTMSAMAAGNISSITTMRPGMSGGPQCRQPPAYKVAQQMARLHRLGRANSHEGVTYRTDHEDGTTCNQIATVHTAHTPPSPPQSPSHAHTPLFGLRSLRLTLPLLTFTHGEEC